MKKSVLTICIAVMLTMCAAAAWAGGIVSFNKATAEELVAIEDVKISAELAKAIVEYRNANGSFKEPTDLLKVPGMTQDFIEELNPVEKDGDIVFDPDAEPALAPSKC
jgi:competence protein ComEA